MSQGYGKNKEETRFVRLHRRRGGLQLSSLLAGRLRRHNTDHGGQKRLSSSPHSQQPEGRPQCAEQNTNIESEQGLTRTVIRHYKMENHWLVLKP